MPVCKCMCSRFNLGLCLEVSGEIDQAIQQFKQTVALIPDDAEAASKVGAMLQARADQPPRAASSTPGGRREKDPLPEIMLAWERVLAIDPECAEAHLRLGLAYEQQDRTEDALNSYLAATKFDPSNADAGQFRVCVCAGALRPYLTSSVNAPSLLP